MNVGGLPGTQVGTAFWWVVGGMATTVVSSLVILRWKKLF
jgi:Mg2+ and Co2+ transporter CorA